MFMSFKVLFDVFVGVSINDGSDEEADRKSSSTCRQHSVALIVILKKKCLAKEIRKMIVVEMSTS